MEKCFYHDFCGARSIHIFQCPQSNCLGRLGGRPTRIFLCRGRRCRERGCPHCPQRAAESDIFTSSDAVSETATTDSSLVSLMRPKSVAGEAAADGAKSVAADGRVRLDGQVDGPGASGVYLVLLDLKTLLSSRRSKTGDIEHVKYRPLAAEFLRFLLRQQDAGRCQLGFCTSFSGSDSFRVVKELLEKATGCSWLQRQRAHGFVLKESRTGRRLWVFDESFGEKRPSCRHDGSQVHMHMKNLASVLSASETLGRTFRRDSLVHLTCVGVEAGKHVDGFELTFMTGFGVSAVHGFADCQLVSYQEMLDAAFRICGSLESICCIGDGDTGYGNAVNVKRTVRGYAQAGMSGVMIEDQVAPKRCGHTKGTMVVSRAEEEVDCGHRKEDASNYLLSKSHRHAQMLELPLDWMRLWNVARPTDRSEQAWSMRGFKRSHGCFVTQPCQ
ncbi:Dml [Symbiodinium natans]|uniref:Dml protein n=1 Tax=Symbiodinium natans TaxID=878477 RepID=A0A812PIF1_9DINO|nr:Dml [Symbiodinium natans]